MRKTGWLTAVITLAGMLLVACGSDADTRSSVREIQSPAGADSGQGNLTAGPDGSVYLSWIEPVGREHALRLAVRDTDGAWQSLGTVAQGEHWFVNYADFPSVAVLPDGTLAAHWLVETEYHAIDIFVSTSRDRGRTWSTPVMLHRDTEPVEHGMVSLVAEPGGGFGAVWLDGRKLADFVNPTDEMALMYTTIDADGNLGPEITLDGKVCECCQTSAAPTPVGLSVVYRDRSDAEIRDISIVRLRDGTWSEPETLSEDGWEIYGCPINGPAISSAGLNVAAAWFTAPQDRPRVNVVLSTDGGLQFGSPIQVDDGNPLGRVGVIALPNGDAFVSWLENSQDGGQIQLRRIAADGRLEPSIVIARTSISPASGFPRMAASGSDIVFAWTDTTDGSIVRTALFPAR